MDRGYRRFPIGPERVLRAARDRGGGQHRRHRLHEPPGMPAPSVLSLSSLRRQGARFASCVHLAWLLTWLLADLNANACCDSGLLQPPAQMVTPRTNHLSTATTAISHVGFCARLRTGRRIASSSPRSTRSASRQRCRRARSLISPAAGG